MSDSDESSKPAPPRRVQPKPRRRVTSKPVGSPTGPAGLSSSNGDSISSPSTTSRIEDDFFSKAKNFREITKAQETKYLEESEPEIKQFEMPDLKPILMTDEMPIFDFEDEAKARAVEAAAAAAAVKKAEEENETNSDIKRKRELSLTPPPEILIRRPPPPAYAPPVYSQPQQSQPIYDILDDDDDEIEGLDPELASIAAKMGTGSQAYSSSSQDLSTSQNSDSGPLSQSRESLSASSLETSTTSSAMPNALSTPPSSLASPSIPVHASREKGASSLSSPGGAAPSSAAEEQDTREIQILLRMRRHPGLVIPNEWLAYYEELEKPVKVTVKSNKNFRSIMDWYGQVKQVDPSTLVFTFRSTRLIPSSTPGNLDFPDRSVIDIWGVEAFKYVKEQEALERNQKLEQLDRQAEEARLAEEARIQEEAAESRALRRAQGEEVEEEGNAEEDDEEKEVEYIFFKIRGKDIADEKIRAKKSTTVGSIINHYKKLKRLSPEAVVKLEFDDEAMDPSMTLGDTDMEDDDMLVAKVA
ncbi:hypothetical protein BGZ83_001457 [Gryganskiella cystojenkinii]|nr:hypothetical protein BGZ83_001457 [Gryganskiella cystojenkinii]